MGLGPGVVGVEGVGSGFASSSDKLESFPDSVPKKLCVQGPEK